MEETLSWPLERAASQFGDNEALVQGDARRTWRDVAERVARLGAGLADLGIGPGDRVAVLAANDSRYFELAHAIPRSGAVLNALNTRLAAAELEWILADSEPSVLVCDDTNLTLARQLRDRCASVHELVRLGTASDGAGDEVPFDELLARGEAPPVDVAPTALATISYTGGTTGRPKGVMLTHGNLLANAKHMLAALPLHETDRYLHAPPMFHAADAMMMFCLTWVGGAHVVIPGFDPELVPASIELEQITVTVLVPTMINMVLGHTAARARDLSSLRLLLYGASPMPDDLRRRAMEVFRCEWAQLYGMTEAAPVVSVLSPSTHRRGAQGEEPFATRLRSAGTPVAGVEAEIRRADGTRAAVGEPGEVVVRGPNIMLGYWNRPEETKAALAGGWYHTGDVAFADDAGYLFIVDRTNDMIISGGENVYSSEVENILYSHPGVDEAAVIGVPDDLWGERVHAIVVPRSATNLDEGEIREHCRVRLAGFKVPRSVEIRTDALPKSAAGKILKRDLRAPYWAGRTRMV